MSELLEMNFTCLLIQCLDGRSVSWEVCVMLWCAGGLRQVTVGRNGSPGCPPTRQHQDMADICYKKLRCPFRNNGNTGPALLCLSDWECRV